MLTSHHLYLPLLKKSLMLLFALLLMAYASSLAWSQEAHPAKAEAEGVTAEVALSRLQGGNERFTSGKITAKDYARERAELAKGQHPYAVVLACSDSRVAPEIIFDESLGKLFIVRVAGHVADPVVLGSVEYAVEHLHANLVMVLGHEGCGAVKATLGGGGSGLPPNIEALVQRITPVVEKTRTWRVNSDDLLSATIKENVRYQMQMALYESEPLSHLVRDKKLKVVGGVYNLRTGRVEMVSAGVVTDAPLGGDAHPIVAAVDPHAAEEAEHKIVKTLTNEKAEEKAHGKVSEKAHEKVEVDQQAPTPHHPEAKHEEKRAPQAPVKVSANAPCLPDLLRQAYEKQMDMVLQKSAQLRDDHDRCASFDCRNIPAGEKVQVASPMILQIGGRPQIRVRYKGALGYINAQESDLGFVSRKH